MVRDNLEMRRCQTPVATGLPRQLGMIHPLLLRDYFLGLRQNPLAAGVLGVSQDAAGLGMVGIFTEDFIEKLISAGGLPRARRLCRGKQGRSLLAAESAEFVIPLAGRRGSAGFRHRRIGRCCEKEILPARMPWNVPAAGDCGLLFQALLIALRGEGREAVSKGRRLSGERCRDE